MSRLSHAVDLYGELSFQRSITKLEKEREWLEYIALYAFVRAIEKSHDIGCEE